MSGTTNIESSVEGKSIRRAAAKLLLLDSNQDQRFQRPVCCRYTKEECARTHRTRMPDCVPPCRSNPFFADWIPGPIPWPITADRLADGARVELARDFRPNSLSRTAPLPHGPPSMPVFRRAGTPGEALTFCELPRRMRVPPILLRAPTRIRTGTACPPSPGHGGVPSPSTRTAGRGSAVSLCVSHAGTRLLLCVPNVCVLRVVEPTGFEPATSSLRTRRPAAGRRPRRKRIARPMPASVGPAVSEREAIRGGAKGSEGPAPDGARDPFEPRAGHDPAT